MQKTQVQSTGREDPLQKEMATHSSILAWKIPWTEELDRPQSMGVTKSRTRLSNWAGTNRKLKTTGKGVYGRKMERCSSCECCYRERILWVEAGVGCAKCYSFESEVAQSCLTLCDPVCYSPPGSSVHGILQARILEWVAISFIHLGRDKKRADQLNNR